MEEEGGFCSLVKGTKFIKEKKTKLEIWFLTDLANRCTCGFSFWLSWQKNEQPWPFVSYIIEHATSREPGRASGKVVWQMGTIFCDFMCGFNSRHMSQVYLPTENIILGLGVWLNDCPGAPAVHPGVSEAVAHSYHTSTRDVETLKGIFHYMVSSKLVWTTQDPVKKEKKSGREGERKADRQCYLVLTSSGWTSRLSSWKGSSRFIS